MNRALAWLRTYGLDVAVVLAAIESALEVAFRDDPATEPTTSHWFAVPAVAVVVLPLLARRRFPFAAPASVWLLAAAVSLVDGQLVTFAASPVVAGVVASFLLGNLPEAAQARLGLVISLAGAAVVVHSDAAHTAGDLFFTPLLFAIAWVAGYAMRERAEQVEAAEVRAQLAEREREAAARVAVAEERARIARELHDIVAHAVSVMVLQVGAVRHSLQGGSPEDRQALEAVERAGRTALAEMRRLLGAMRNEDEDVDLAPQPGLGSLEELADQVGRAGLPVRLHVDDELPALPYALDLSAYRIVQEGLTNALKHARATCADVTVRYEDGDLFVEVRDDGRGMAADDGRGHGLVGVRERVKIYGGEMSAAAVAGGGFVLQTRLPVGGTG